MLYYLFESYLPSQSYSLHPTLSLKARMVAGRRIPQFQVGSIGLEPPGHAQSRDKSRTFPFLFLNSSFCRIIDGDLSVNGSHYFGAGFGRRD